MTKLDLHSRYQRLGLCENFVTTQISEAQQSKSQWAGGSTTQLAIGPPQSSLAARNFRWRFSSAEVHTDGVFSDFTGYQRWLALRAGHGITLQIEPASVDGKQPAQSVILRDFTTVIAFDGAAITTGLLTAGPVQDLNLIVSQQLSVTLTAMSLPQFNSWLGETKRLCTPDDVTLHLLLAQTPIQIQTLSKQWNLARGDVLLFVESTDWLQVQPWSCHDHATDWQNIDASQDISAASQPELPALWHARIW